MNIKFDKDKMIEEINKISEDFEQYNQGYECDEDEYITEDEFKERIEETLDFVNSLTEDKLQNAVKGFKLKKNGKPRIGAIATIFVMDVGYWFVEWYVTFGTHRIVARAIDENNMEVVIEKANINTGEFPYVIGLD